MERKVTGPYKHSAKFEKEKLEKELKILNFIETRGKKIDGIFHVLGLKRQLGSGEILKEFKKKGVVEFLGPLFKMRNSGIGKIFEDYFRNSQRNFFLSRTPHVARVDSKKLEEFKKTLEKRKKTLHG